MKKRARLNVMLDGLCGMLGIERTDNNKAIITRVLIASRVNTDHLNEIATLIQEIMKEEEDEL
jgi:hypothetical protein